MRLIKAKISGYRSIKDEIELIIDRKITVVLGANDHGKTNLLEALIHINANAPFASDDLNWDLDGEGNTSPSLTCTFELLPVERQELQRTISENTLRHALHDAAYQQLKAYQESLQQDASAEAEAEPPNRDQSEILLLNTAIEYLALRQGFTIGALRETSSAVFDSLANAVNSFNKIQEQAASLVSKNVELKAAHDQAASTNNKVAAQQHMNSIQANNVLIKKAEQEKFEQQDFQKLARLVLERRSDFDAWISSSGITAPEVTIPETVNVCRTGLESDVQVTCSDELYAAGFPDLVYDMLPRVELVRFTKGITDAVTSEDINKADFEFMRGIFYYAGLKKEEWPAIFEQTDHTARRLSKASNQLNNILRRNWSQGNNLEFALTHDSKQGQIRLSILDPSVEARFVRASQRSTGFTNFFALKTILHARMQEASAASYIWLFDEPGVYLHPHGQNDLLQVFETLSATNQIVYCTHSLFMLNKNFPQRHRLVLKSDRGTRIDQKPYRAQWSSAISSLGLGLPGTILFANRIALVEGDSDPIYMNALMQKAIEAGWIDADINQLSFISTGESKNADALIRYLLDAAIRPKIVLIFDGDEGGKARKKNLDSIIKAHNLETYTLQVPSVEDCLYSVTKLLPLAVCRYVAKISGKQTDSLLEQAEGSVKELGEKISWSQWSRQVGKDLAKLESELSSVGIAREYAQLLEDTPADALDGKANKAAMALIKWLSEKLELPTTTIREESVVQSTSVT